MKSGIKELGKFGVLPTIYALCNGDLTKQDQILLMPYHEIFNKLHFDHDLAEFQEKYRKIISKKK